MCLILGDSRFPDAKVGSRHDLGVDYTFEKKSQTKSKDKKAEHTLSDGGQVGLSFRSSLRLGIGLGGLICPNLGGGLRRCQRMLDNLGLIQSLGRYPYPGGGDDLGGGGVLGYIDGFYI